MSDFPDGSTLVEAITGKWHRLEQGLGKGTFLIELSETTLLNVHVNTKSIDIVLKDEQGVFRYMGDITFSGLEELEKKLMVHSLGIDHVHFNNRDVRIDNPDNKMSTVFIQLSHEKKEETKAKLMGL